MTTRIPAIVQNILSDYADIYPAALKQRLQDLLAELLENKPVRSLETIAPDGPGWTEAWFPYRNKKTPTTGGCLAIAAGPPPYR